MSIYSPSSRYGNAQIGAMLDRALEVLPHLSVMTAAGAAPTAAHSDIFAVSHYRVQLETASRLIGYALTGELTEPTLQLPLPQPRTDLAFAPELDGPSHASLAPAALLSAMPGAKAEPLVQSPPTAQTAVTTEAPQPQFPRQHVKLLHDLGDAQLKQPAAKHFEVHNLANRQRATLPDSQDLGSTTFIWTKRPPLQDAAAGPQQMQVHDLPAGRQVAALDMHLGSAHFNAPQRAGLQAEPKAAAPAGQPLEAPVALIAEDHLPELVPRVHHLQIKDLPMPQRARVTVENLELGSASFKPNPLTAVDQLALPAGQPGDDLTQRRPGSN